MIGMAVHTCFPSMWKVETRELRVQDLCPPSAFPNLRVVTPLGCNPFTGVIYQIFTLQFITVAKLQLWSSNKINFIAGGQHSMRKVEDYCSRHCHQGRVWYVTKLSGPRPWGHWSAKTHPILSSHLLDSSCTATCLLRYHELVTLYTHSLLKMTILY